MRVWPIFAASVAVLSLASGSAAPGAAATTSPTIVSLTFDDGSDTQAPVVPMLDAHGMKGTFYVPSGDIGQAGYLSWAQLTSMAADGQEIAGHTLNHEDLTTVSSTEAKYQVCEDRARLLKHGFSVTDFAYPYGSGWHNSTIRQIVQGCGYNSARGAWGLAGGPCNCYTATAETIPPQDLWAIRTTPEPQSTTTLDQIESYVTAAETHGGGWVILTFHDICDGCDPAGYSTTQATLQAFLDWLQSRAATGTTVKTVNQVIGGAAKPSPGTADTTAPISSIGCNGTPCTTGWYNAPVMVGFSGTDSGGSGLEAIRYTTDGSTPSLTSPVYTGPFSVTATTSFKYRAWDNAGNVESTHSQLISVDMMSPTSSISCNGGACSSGWYGGAVTAALSATDDSSGVAAIRYTTDGTDPTSSSPLYIGPLSISATTTVKYRAWDNAGNVESTHSQLIQIDTAAPSVAIVAPVNGAAVTGNVQVQASASDADSGIGRVEFYLDGKLSSASTTSPYKWVWNTKKTPKGSHTLYAIAVDIAGNKTTSAGIAVTVK